MRRLDLLLIVAMLIFAGQAAVAQRLLIPMDLTQTDHLRAYGVTYNAIKAGAEAEWLLNYRG
ncbi:asparagine synthetase B, partial [bacterium]|nr:asparagine synthetase B [bacterium]